jgi:hypothetical protein
LILFYYNYQQIVGFFGYLMYVHVVVNTENGFISIIIFINLIVIHLIIVIINIIINTENVIITNIIHRFFVYIHQSFIYKTIV